MPKQDLILLALDKSHTLDLMERALRAVNYEIAIAGDTKTLSRLLQDSTPALLLVGEKFDEHDGLDIVEELLERFPTLPFLIYTEKVKPEFVKQIFKLGVTGYLTPPLKTDDIVGTVEGVLKHAYRVGDWLRREVNRTTTSLKKRAHISESERSRLETVFNSIQDSVMLFDQETHIILLNPAMCKSFNLDGKSSVGKTVADVIDHPDLLAMLEDIKNNKNNDPTHHHEISFPDGRVGSAQVTPISDIGYAVTMQDITYLKEVDRVRNEVVHTVSHDLRSPLTSVIGYTELITRAGPLNDNQQEFLKRIQESVAHINTLINDLLELGSIEAGLDTRREWVQLDVLLLYSLDMLQGQIKSKHIKVQSDVSESLPALQANPVRLRQVFDNVVGNAIKYSNKNGEVKIFLKAEGDQIILQVTDNGPGIPAQDQAHIFDKFYRGKNMDKQQGSGLGLAIVKSIVDAHRGRMWVESTVGQGSSFFIVLPVNRLPSK
ncbi:MAG TPA: ATP-binding protein [Anaerolineales bacterium]|nr:ATP-binding protein [Anaerolineales bacterium]